MMQTRFTDEATIIKAIRERNSDVFEYLRNRYYRSVRMMIKSNSGSEEDVEDVYSEGLACLIEVVDDPKQKLKNKVSTVFISICKNLWLNILRSRRLHGKHSRSLNDPVYEEQFEEQMDKAIYKDIFWQSFAKLKADCQQILHNIMEGKRIREIAELMGLSHNYLGKKKHYCHQSLLQIIYANPGYAAIQRTEVV
jgi:RNA polymerase sigma factor (sigma-70 family)